MRNMVTSALPAATLREKRAVNPTLILCLASVYVIWSSTYLAMRVAVAELPPMLTAGARYLTAGVVMLAVARVRGAPWPSLRQWLRVVPAGALLFIGGNGFVAVAETSVSSGGAAVVCATMPLWAGVLSAATGERPTLREWGSLGLGFLGVIVLMGSPSLDGEPLHRYLLIASPICWAIGSIYTRRLPKPVTKTAGDTFMAPAMQMLTGGASVILVGLVRGEHVPTAASGEALACVAYLIVFGSIIGFTAYDWLLRNARPVVATSYAFVNPVMAVLIGAALYGEPLSWQAGLANALIVGAVLLALKRK